MFRPMRDTLLVRQMEPVREQGAIVLRETLEALSPAEVLAIGPDVWDIAVGEVVLVDGYRSGIKLGDDEYCVSQSICFACQV